MNRDIAGIPAEELADRVARARERAGQLGLDGFVVVARGGGPFERHGNLMYLTGHYTTFPTIPDHAPHWRLRGHAAAVVGPERTILLSDDHPIADRVHADEVRETSDLPAAVAQAARDVGLAGRRVGLVGSDVLSAHHARMLDAELPGLEPADDLLARLRLVKSPAERELLRRAGQAGAAAISAAMEAMGAGATEQEAAAEAARVAMEGGAAVANVFTGVHGPDRPPRRRLHPSYADDAPVRSGDVFTIDMSGALDGYFFDFSRSRVVGEDRHGGEATLAIARDVVAATVDALRPGATAGDAAARGFAVIDRAGDDLAEGRFAALGHGLGLGFEDPWLTADDDTVLRPGMCIAVEKFVRRGAVAAAFEHNVLVTDGKPEILSIAPLGWES